MSFDVAALVSDNLDLWTSAIERKSGAGRGGGKNVSLYGIERLRSLILNLAVRGKLVPQDASDVPATELLKSIKADQARLIRSEAIGKRKVFPAVSAEPPFAIPDSWTWVQISDVGHDWGQAEPQSDFTYIDVGSIDQGVGVVRSPAMLSASAAPSRARRIVKRGTVIYSTVRPYLLNIAIIDQDFDPQPIASTAFAVVHPFDGVQAEYVFRYLRSPAFVRYVESCQTGIAYPAINDRQFFAAWFPLPPAAEQKRIVTKVDELMALCDALETQSASAMEAHQALVKALLATLVAAADTADLAHQWTRLERHFDTLFINDSSVEALKLTVVDLAIQGKLTSRGQPWPMKSLGDFVVDAAAGWSPKCLETARSDDRWGVLKVSAVTWGKFQPNENKELPSSLEPRPEIEVRPGDFLISRANTADLVGRSVVVPPGAPEKLMMSDKIIRFRFDENIDAAYVNIVHASSIARKYYSRVAGGTSSSMKNVSQSQVRALRLPVPDIEEQRDVVRRIDQLHSLCERLKVGLAESATTRRLLADAVFERAVA